MSGFIEIDISENSKDPCKHMLIDYFRCLKGQNDKDTKKKCFHFGSDYLDCKTDPKNLRLVKTRPKLE